MCKNNFYKILFGIPDTNLAKLIKFSLETGIVKNEGLQFFHNVGKINKIFFGNWQTL